MAAQEIRNRLEIPLFEHPGLLRGRVRVIGNRIPRAEHDVVETGERHELADQRRSLVRALAKTDRRHLRERPDRLGQPAAYALDAGNERGGDRAKAWGQNPEAAGRWTDGVLRTPRTGSLHVGTLLVELNAGQLRRRGARTLPVTGIGTLRLIRCETRRVRPRRAAPTAKALVAW